MALEGSIILLGLFFGLLFVGMPLGVALGIAGVTVIGVEKLGIMAFPTNVWTGIAKYPLLALPVFIVAGMVFERSGVAERLVRFAAACVGNRTGGLAVVAVLVCMILGGISGSGPADAAAVAAVLAPAMLKQGYPRPYIASLTAAAGSTAILIPPSIAFIVYSVLVPGVSLNALFVGGLIPGILAGLSLLVPAIWLCKRGGFGMADPNDVRPPLWQTFKEAIWGLAAPVVILGGMRSGAFTPTEAAVVAVFYGLFVGVFIYRTLDFQAVYKVLADSAEIAAVVMIIIALASVFAHAGSTVGSFDAAAKTLIAFTASETVMLLAITVILLIAGMLIDGVSIFLVFLPILLPIAKTYGWDLTWFGILMTMNIAIGQFTPPMAVNLMVTCKVAGCSMESTVPWVIWFVLSMLLALLLVTFFPDIALFLPRWMGDL
ncbi:MAG: TRAP transporter large permease [Bosea sp.]|jgi:C4-dicarboxylate transporter DctM subunit|nr:TRAP transporter large permease [Bosea sp. (in: a-proteobacteria)]